jgi:hypothetical protein
MHVEFKNDIITRIRSLVQQYDLCKVDHVVLNEAEWQQLVRFRDSLEEILPIGRNPLVSYVSPNTMLVRLDNGDSVTVTNAGA